MHQFLLPFDIASNYATHHIDKAYKQLKLSIIWKKKKKQKKKKKKKKKVGTYKLHANLNDSLFMITVVQLVWIND